MTNVQSDAHESSWIQDTPEIDPQNFYLEIQIYFFKDPDGLYFVSIVIYR
jgi:hypothetical protein